MGANGVQPSIGTLDWSVHPRRLVRGVGPRVNRCPRPGGGGWAPRAVEHRALPEWERVEQVLFGDGDGRCPAEGVEGASGWKRHHCGSDDCTARQSPIMRIRIRSHSRSTVRAFVHYVNHICRDNLTPFDLSSEPAVCGTSCGTGCGTTFRLPTVADWK